jgi:hypothetical protein
MLLPVSCPSSPPAREDLLLLASRHGCIASVVAAACLSGVAVLLFGCSGSGSPEIAEKNRQGCHEMLQRIAGAKHSYARVYSLSDGVSLTSQQVDELGEYMWGGWQSNMCPAGGEWVLGRIGEEPRCTFHSQCE